MKALKYAGKITYNSNIFLIRLFYCYTKPYLVKAWHESGCMAGLDWSSLKLFTSTGECSNGIPIIEYCGGTEIGGAYITSTLIQPIAPAAFMTPALGIDFIILNEARQKSVNGEAALIPPSIGLSTTLLNKDHYQVYFDGLCKLSDGRALRRHGDKVELCPNGFYQLLGRIDDTMNFGGIKISASEIEHILNSIDGIYETAAVADALPRTVSNKILRRELHKS